MELKYLLYEQKDKIGIITLNRQEACNALTVELLSELSHFMHELDWGKEVRVVIVKGAGTGFSSGYDIDTIAQRDDFDLRTDLLRHQDFLAFYSSVRNRNFITIGQLHGYCLNGGLDLCQQFDFNIVSDDCLIGCPVHRRLASSIIQTWLYNVGPQWAKYLMMTGDTVDGQMGEKIGFAIKSVPADRLEKTVTNFAERLAQIDKDLLTAHKAMVNRGLDLMGFNETQGNASQEVSIANRSEGPMRNFHKLCGLGVEAMKKNLNEGFKPQKAPFEPLDD